MMYRVCLVRFLIAAALPFAVTGQPQQQDALAPSANRAVPTDLDPAVIPDLDRAVTPDLDPVIPDLDPAVTPDLDRAVIPTYDDCAEIYGVLFWVNALQDGVFDIKPEATATPFPVYCDMTTADGGWTVIQRRFNGSLNFNRFWADYEDGFGNVDGEHWLGLQDIHDLVSQAHYELYIEIEDWEGNVAYARYNTFGVGDAADKYRLTIGGYSGDASDCMVQHHNLNGMQFSTRDRDNDMHTDIHCAQAYSNAWWHNSCTWSGLNGPYFKPEHYRGRQTGLGVFWAYWTGDPDGYYSLKATKMMVRPADFTRRAWFIN